MAGSPFDTERVLNDVREERQRQVAKGWTYDHDDQHDAGEFAALIDTYTAQSVDAAFANDPDPVAARARMVQVAALAVAAVESMDRRAV